jgi:copper chaperone CopZ
MTTKRTWTVEGENTLHCAGCNKTIEFALSRLPGVQRAKADYRSQRIEVDTSDDADVGVIVAELNELGYSVREVTDHDHARS